MAVTLDGGGSRSSAVYRADAGGCLGKSRTSFLGHPDAILFLRISREGVFQHPRDISNIDRHGSLGLPRSVDAADSTVSLFDAYTRSNIQSCSARFIKVRFAPIREQSREPPLVNSEEYFRSFERRLCRNLASICGISSGSQLEHHAVVVGATLGRCPVEVTLRVLHQSC